MADEIKGGSGKSLEELGRTVSSGVKEALNEFGAGINNNEKANKNVRDATGNVAAAEAAEDVIITRELKQAAGQWIKNAGDKAAAAKRIRTLLRANRGGALKQLLETKPPKVSLNTLINKVNAANNRYRKSLQDAVKLLAVSEKGSEVYPEKFANHIIATEKASTKAYQKLAKFLRMDAQKAMELLPRKFTKTSTQMETLEAEHRKLEAQIQQITSVAAERRTPNMEADLRRLEVARDKVAHTLRTVYGKSIGVAGLTGTAEDRYNKLQESLTAYDQLVQAHQSAKTLAERFRGSPAVVKESISRTAAAVAEQKKKIEETFGVGFKREKFTDQIKRTLLKSRWAFLTFSTVTAILVSRVIGVLAKLASTMIRMPWDAMKKGAAAFYALGKSILFVRDRFRQYEVALNGVLQSSTKAAQISTFAKEYAAKYPAMYEDIMKTFTLLAQNPQIKPFIKAADTRELKKFMDIVQMLGKLNPEQGVAGARFAISKAFAGNYRSLMMRFNLPAEVLAGTIGKKRSDLTDPHILLQALDAYVKLNGGAKLLAESANTLQTHIGNLADKWKMFLDVIGKSGAYKSALHFFGQLDEVWGRILRSPVATQLGSIISGVITKLMAYGERLLKIFSPESFRSFATLQQAFNKFVDAVGGAIDKVESLFVDMYSYLSHILVPLFTDLGVQIGKAFIEGVFKAIFTSPDLNKMNPLQMGAGIPDFSKKATDPYKSMMRDTLRHIKEGFPTIKKDVIDLLNLSPNFTPKLSTGTYSPLQSYIAEYDKISEKLQHYKTLGTAPNEVLRLGRQKNILGELISSVKKQMMSMTPDMWLKTGSHIVSTLYDSIKKKFETTPLRVALKVALSQQSIASQLSDDWTKIIKTTNLGHAASQKQFERFFKNSIAGASAIVSSSAKSIWEKALVAQNTGTQAAQSAFNYLTSSFANITDKLRYKISALMSSFNSLPKFLRQNWQPMMVAALNTVADKIDSFNQKLLQMTQRMDSLKMKKFMVDINRNTNIYTMESQLAKAQGKPYNLAEKLYDFGRRIWGHEWAATTQQGKVGYLQQAASVFKQAFTESISQHNFTLANDALDKYKRVTYELAGLKKNTLNDAINRLSDRMGALNSSTGTLNSSVRDLIIALRSAVDKFNVAPQVRRNINDAAQDLLATASSMGF